MNGALFKAKGQVADVMSLDGRNEHMQSLFCVAFLIPSTEKYFFVHILILQI